MQLKLNDKIYPCLIAISGIVNLYPVVFADNFLVVKITQIILFILFLLKFGRNKNNLGLILVVITFVYYIIYIEKPSWVTFGFLIFIVIIGIENEILIKSATIFENFLAVILLSGLTIHFLIILGLDLPYYFFELEHKISVGHFYRGYLLNVELLNYSYEKNYFRFCGIFDEPGVIGSLVGLILIVRKMTLMNFKNIIFYTAGFASESKIFYILIAYGIIINLNKKLLLLLSFSLVLFIIFFDTIPTEEFKFFLNRESDCFKDIYGVFLKSDSIYFGLGPNFILTTGCDISFYKSIFVDYGFILGSFLIILNFYVYINKSIICKQSKKQIYNFIFIFLIPIILVFMQRPIPFLLANFLILFIYFSKYQEKANA
jgi:hypothetical protein